MIKEYKTSQVKTGKKINITSKILPADNILIHIKLHYNEILSLGIQPWECRILRVKHSSNRVVTLKGARYVLEYDNKDGL